MLQLLITPSFQTSLARLQKQEANLVKQTLFDVMTSPELPGHRLHPLKLKGKNFWSISPNMDLRVVAWRDGERLTAMHVAHHDAAYRWAERWKLKKNETTGAMQPVPDPDLLAEDIGPPPAESKPFFADEDQAYLLSLGVPPEVLHVVRQVATTEQLYRLVNELPEEAGIALLELFDGARPEPRPVHHDLLADPFAHPDARRRFWVATDEAILAEILERPWDEWLIFLHPSQREAVERSFKGPARVSGAAGTGKTVVAMHRAARLARASEDRVLLTAYSRTLAWRLGRNMDRLLGDDTEARKRVEVSHLHRFAHAQARSLGSIKILKASDLPALVRESRGDLDPSVSDAFLRNEWDAVIDYWAINSLDAYEKAPRVGRGTPLSQQRRRQVWDVFRRMRETMDANGLLTFSDLCDRARATIETSGIRPFRHVIVDEAQDFGPRELQLLMALAEPGPDALFFAGDIGQRIHRWPFPWKDLGVDLRGNAMRLKVNYRTTDEIRRFSEALLPARLTEPDGGDVLREVRSLLRGGQPELIGCHDLGEEIQVIERWLHDLIDAGVEPGDIAIFGRIRRELYDRVTPVLRNRGLEGVELSDGQDASGDAVILGTLHNAKGLEFRAVAIVGCTSRLLPFGPEVSNTPEALQDLVREKERNLLYVGSSRARESLLLTWFGEPSPFLVPLIGR